MTHFGLLPVLLVFCFTLFPGVALGNTAGVVVVHGDERVVIKVVEFGEPSISGVDLLRRSGLTNSIVEGSAGQAVYMIDGEGDPNGWVTTAGKNYYWSYFQMNDGKWQYSKVGASAAEVKDGDVQGWLWQYYGQGRLFPAISIPEMKVTVSSEQVGSPKSAATSETVTHADVKAATNKTGIISYAIFGLIVLVLGTVFALLIRFRGR